MTEAWRAPGTAPRTWPGSPNPLGARWDGEGVNFAVFTEGADSVDLCLLDAVGEQRVPLVEQTYNVWHGYVPGPSPGQRYGFRVRGRNDPGQGLRWNAAKLLVDPYARALTGRFDNDPSCYDDNDLDSAAHVPHSVVVRDDFPWGEDRTLRTPWADTVLYELHVKGFTAQHPDVPPALRGTYAGLAHPAVIDHLTALGVTAVELMPVHHFVDEPHLLEAGLTNYWGYNSLGYFAPHAAYSAAGSTGEQVREFKAMVRALHRAGIEVVLDVVYNHTAEGGADGPTLSFRGYDNPAYYRLEDGDPSRYRDYTGCGNTLDARQPHVLQLIMDSLRYWVTECHIDGFRFDLAAALARSLHDVDKLSAFFDLVQQDPVISQAKLIAEPWDVGDGGYQVGGFPALWTEWNGKYRDTLRSFWNSPGSDAGWGAFRDLGYRLTGSSDLYAGTGRNPSASINFITAHDGFTMADLVSHDHKHNGANGENNRDGTDDNNSSGAGAEGLTSDPAILRVRRRRRRALLATLLLSSGVPMLVAGDELGRTQQGNNNAYCQDNGVSWVDWTSGAAHDPAGDDPLLMDIVALLIDLRQRSPVLRQQAFFEGHRIDGTAVKDIGWFNAQGVEMTGDDWFARDEPALVAYLSGAAIRTRGPRGEQVTDDSYVLALNPSADDVPLTLPGAPWAGSYAVVLDTSADTLQPPATVPRVIAAQSLLLLRVTG